MARLVGIIFAPFPCPKDLCMVYLPTWMVDFFANYCWWKKYPAPPEVYKTLQMMGYLQTINWWVYRISGCHQHPWIQGRRGGGSGIVITNLQIFSLRLGCPVGWKLWYVDPWWTDQMGGCTTPIYPISVWWFFQPLWEIITVVKMGSSSPGRGDKCKNNWNHHLDL